MTGRWQVRNRNHQRRDALAHAMALDRRRNGYPRTGGAIPLNITPYYASLLDPMDSDQPMRRMVGSGGGRSSSAPETNRTIRSREDHDTPAPGLVHRYPDRVLFLVTGFCSTHCRYCTRSRMVGRHEEIHADRERWERAIAYIENTPTVRDILLSGGDPLTLPTKLWTGYSRGSGPFRTSN